MDFLRQLCCVPSSKDATTTEKQTVRSPQETPKTESPDPEGASKIILELYQKENTNKATNDILIPYLEKEYELRKAFAAGDAGIDKLANLVPIYAGHEKNIKTRNVDRELNADDKYIMRLPEAKLQAEHAMAIVPSLEDYKRNFQGFTHGVLKGLDWQNVVAAGSSALLPLLPRRNDTDMAIDPAEEDEIEGYFQNVASTSDIDLFIYGLGEEAAVEKILQIESVLRKEQRLAPDTGLTLRTANAITFVSPRWPYRHVQIILRLYRSVSEILTGFDIDCACVAFDGKQVYSNPRGIASISTRTNTIDISRRSPSYESRLFKYRTHNFDAYWDFLDRSQINMDICGVEANPNKLMGLGRLICLEAKVKTFGDVRGYHQVRRLKKIAESGNEASHSSYTSHEIPYGRRFTPSKVRRYVGYRSQEPHLFGTARDVVHHGAKKGKLAGPVAFLKDDPGRQTIGSFYPTTDDDWTESAYSNKQEEAANQEEGA